MNRGPQDVKCRPESSSFRCLCHQARVSAALAASGLGNLTLNVVGQASNFSSSRVDIVNTICADSYQHRCLHLRAAPSDSIASLNL